MINLELQQSRVAHTVKGKYGFKNTSEAVNCIVQAYQQHFLEPELRPEYVERLKTIEKEPHTSFKTAPEARKILKNA